MMNNTPSTTWDLEIKPQTNIFDLRLKDVWNYRDLLLLLVRRDFVSFYKQTILGPLWFFIQPLLTTITYTLIFGRIAGLSTDGLPQPLFYMAGVTAWTYFAECLTKTSTVFKDNSNIFGKVYFPRLIMPLSIVISNLVKFGVQLLLFVLLIVFYSFGSYNWQPTWHLMLFPYLIMLMALMGLGLGTLISAITNKYRDLAFLITFGVQLAMYATPVVYPLSEVGPEYQWLISLNPMTAIIETFRSGFLGAGSFNWQSLCYSSAFTLIVLALGTIVFNRVEKTFMDTV